MTAHLFWTIVYDVLLVAGAGLVIFAMWAWAVDYDPDTKFAQTHRCPPDRYNEVVVYNPPRVNHRSLLLNGLGERQEPTFPTELGDAFAIALRHAAEFEAQRLKVVALCASDATAEFDKYRQSIDADVDALYHRAGLVRGTVPASGRNPLDPSPRPRP